MSHRPIAYSYEADHHCPDCAFERFGVDADGFITGIDNEGNEVHALFSWDEWWEPSEPGRQTLTCGDCHGEIAVVGNEFDDFPANDDEWEYRCPYCTIKVSKVGGGTIGRAYDGHWHYSIVVDGAVRQGSDLYTGSPHTHEQAAHEVAAFFDPESS